MVRAVVFIIILFLLFLLFVSGCGGTENPGLEGMFNPENFEEIQKADPYSAEFPDLTPQNVSISDFFPKK